MQRRPTIQRLKKLFALSPTGELERISLKKGRNIDGSVGSIRANGYVRVKVDYIDIYAHHIVWALFHGSWPLGDIDHINCNRSDNRIENLRLATKRQNQGNKSKKRGKLLPKGVQMAPSGRYCAYIQYRGTSRYLGTYDNPDDASDAYAMAARQCFGEFARAS